MQVIGYFTACLNIGKYCQEEKEFTAMMYMKNQKVYLSITT